MDIRALLSGPHNKKLVWAFIAFLLFGKIARIFSHSPPPEDEVFGPKAIQRSKALKAELSAAVRDDNWQRVRILHTECKRVPTDNGSSLWLPSNCDPVLLLHESITAQARNVYHGLANSQAYNLPSNWRLNEDQYFTK